MIPNFFSPSPPSDSRPKEIAAGRPAKGWFARVFLIGIALTFAVSPARADDADTRKAEAKLQVDKAELSYKLGRFEDALQAPALLFNMGQCQKNLGNYDRAIFFFEGYLREATNPDRRRLAQELLDESRKDLERQQALALQPPPESAAAATPDAGATSATASPPDGGVGGASDAAVAATTGNEPMPPAVELAARAPVLQEPLSEPTLLLNQPAGHPDVEEDRAPGLTHRWWFWTALAAGTLAIAAGAIVYYETGPTTTVLPGGSAGTLDRR
jgi:tetratricopeptide (TPR) repeat protein